MSGSFQLITPTHHRKLLSLAKKISTVDISLIANNLAGLIEQIRADIPEKKRISCGRYNIIKEMGLEMYPGLERANIDVFAFATGVFSNHIYDHFVRSFAIQLISIYGVKTKDLKKVLPVFENAAVDKSWEVRECSSGFVRKLTKEFPKEMHEWYFETANSKDSQQRRFASESLRPVVENRWIHKQPDFAFSIIKHLFHESDSYPRTSVGNNLSDWMRIDEQKTIKIIKMLAKNGNKDSYWIAYRACRNLVKTKPLVVLSLLDVEEYVYKGRVEKAGEQSHTEK